ncbi:hypothetical protein TKK_0007628 [Trichogramma kaykai]
MHEASFLGPYNGHRSARGTEKEKCSYPARPIQLEYVVEAGMGRTCARDHRNWAEKRKLVVSENSNGLRRPRIEVGNEKSH